MNVLLLTLLVYSAPSEALNYASTPASSRVELPYDLGIEVYIPGPPTGEVRPRLRPDGKITKREACYSAALLESAKVVVAAAPYLNRPKGVGDCAKGVWDSITQAGMNNRDEDHDGDWDGLGHAIEYASWSLADRGFRFIWNPTLTEESAPAGAILVYSGPDSGKYLLRESLEGRSDLSDFEREQLARLNKELPKDKKLTGNEVGHVTIKGDDGYFYTDGRTVEPAVADRILVGMWVMSDCSHCAASVRFACYKPRPKARPYRVHTGAQ